MNDKDFWILYGVALGLCLAYLIYYWLDAFRVYAKSGGFDPSIYSGSLERSNVYIRFPLRS